MVAIKWAVSDDDRSEIDQQTNQIATRIMKGQEQPAVRPFCSYNAKKVQHG